eukprot:3777616-Prymnesium_polylepis.2
MHVPADEDRDTTKDPEVRSGQVRWRWSRIKAAHGSTMTMTGGITIGRELDVEARKRIFHSELVDFR